MRLRACVLTYNNDQKKYFHEVVVIEQHAPSHVTCANTEHEPHPHPPPPPPPPPPPSPPRAHARTRTYTCEKIAIVSVDICNNT